ncbi:hypothetical protein [Acanthamoeba castellanii mimivirus]|uniref:Uncharacterized protein R489 n=4 Tax=Mimivirus TaxID=315393 RepID=YR489_MIMIV|nr:hypothetical protein MIMI_gp0527 [Acanthamoeba polyphaga mimivirus]Q5UQF7.1 RecName: Full=Uncharacterized protein R489; Flags: Precursor [Acanthamoeba polyphaga mimivirus]AEQ60680.1 hypothetical protein [Acanthamoeba castellanii mamavirus]AHA45367.1 hypothetical protein HIRU_S461 [Hirudovirus strain Sangsue]ALR84078.1 hypothetical protein [Niemeyer virus]AMZ02932.1 hypothetical protein [Mimivirus Bombay]EJN40923.1 hypothetical protein lvs_R419 [Acanthamoeba polyphaga lentillevirus]QTF4940
MAKFNNNILLIILIIVILFIIFYFLNKNNQSNTNNNYPVSHFSSNVSRTLPVNTNVTVPTVNDCDELSENIVESLLSKYDSSMMSDRSPFHNLVQQKQQTLRSYDGPYDNDESDDRDFTYKKNKFTRRTPNDLNDLFDVNKMLPQETEEDWFDDLHMKNAKHINNTHMIHPKKHRGLDTIGSTHKNATHDLRGDIPNPKMSVSPWGNSTIEPDVFARGLCG